MPTPRRHCLTWFATALWLGSRPAGANTASVDAALRQDGTVLLLRHALAPGGGDPDTFRLGDCSTQRNLSEAGRQQAQRFGAHWRAQGWRLGGLWASPWCRTLDTARLAFPDTPVQAQAVMGSFFQQREQEASQTAAARAALQRWQGPGVLVAVTHQVNITALTGVVPGQGEGVVLRPHREGLHQVGLLPPP
jgi:broad specificity phosphatase PhoE